VIGWIGRVSPMHAGYVESAAEDAWRRMLDFFAVHLAAEQPARQRATGRPGGAGTPRATS
jgi:hypothetical protein